MREVRPSEVMRHLGNFVEDPDEVATMTPEQIRAELEAEGVDVEAQRARLRERLEAIRASRSAPTEEPGGGEGREENP